MNPKPDTPKTFAEWSNRFKGLRGKDTTAPEVIDVYRMPVPGDWKRKGWERTLGYRKNTYDGGQHGEQKIEHEMLGPKGTVRLLDLIDKRGNRTLQIVTLYSNFPLANQRDGQVIADVFGVVRIGQDVHPLMVEVKTTHQDPWWALVECLHQVKLARASEKLMRTSWGQTISPQPKGAWGLVVAPKSYYDKSPGWEEKCRPLLIELKTKTEARIAFADTVDLAKGQLNLRLSNWA